MSCDATRVFTIAAVYLVVRCPCVMSRRCAQSPRYTRSERGVVEVKKRGKKESIEVFLGCVSRGFRFNWYERARRGGRSVRQVTLEQRNELIFRDKMRVLRGVFVRQTKDPDFRACF